MAALEIEPCGMFLEFLEIASLDTASYNDRVSKKTTNVIKWFLNVRRS